MVNHVDGMDLNVLIKLVLQLLRHLQLLHNVKVTYHLVLLIIQLVELFKDVKIYQQLVLLENQTKIVKLQELDSQHVFGFHLHQHVLKNLVLLPVLQEQLVHYQQEDLHFQVAKII